MPELPLCFECNSFAVHDHHVIPRSLGGTKTLPLCEGCHGKIHGLEMVGQRNLIRKVLTDKKSRGEMTGAPRFGYRLGADGVHVEPDDREQTIIHRARGLREQGLSFRAIETQLAREGVVGRAGTPLTLPTVHAIAK